MPLTGLYLDYDPETVSYRACIEVAEDEGGHHHVLEAPPARALCRIIAIHEAFQLSACSGLLEQPTLPVIFTEDGSARLHLEAFDQFWSVQLLS